MICKVVDMVEMVVATEEAVEAAVATAVAAVAMEAAATEVDAVSPKNASDITVGSWNTFWGDWFDLTLRWWRRWLWRRWLLDHPWTKTTFKRSIFDLRFPFMHISYYSAMQYCHSKTVFFLHL